jgi:hypothetical protein
MHCAIGVGVGGTATGRLGGGFPPEGSGAAGGAGGAGLGVGGRCTIDKEALGIEGLCGGLKGGTGGREQACGMVVVAVDLEELVIGTRAHRKAGAFPLDMGRVGR